MTDELRNLAKKVKIEDKLGFDGRMFLTRSEWMLYRRRHPVRYIKKKKQKVCSVCEQAELHENSLQWAHRIPFIRGVVQLALTPEFLDSEENLVTAHKKECNKASELDLVDSMGLLHSKSVENLPVFLPKELKELWGQVKLL